MKKLFISLILSVFSFFSFSQNESFIPYFNNGEPYQFQNNLYESEKIKTEDSLIKLHNIETLRVYSFDKKGNKRLYSISTYDSNENEFSIWKLTKKRIGHESQLVTNSHRVYQWKSWGGRKKQYNTYQTINGKKYLKDKIVIKRNKLKSRMQYFWNENARVDSTYWFKQNQAEPQRVTHYFYKNKKLAESKIYIKGKLNTVRKYDCEPLGEVQKKVKTSKSCKNTEFDKDGNRIDVHEYTNSKGKTRIYKVTCVGKTDKILRRESFDFKGRQTFFEEKTDTSTITKRYNKRGKLRGKTVEKYSDKKIIERTYYNKSKIRSKRTFTYNLAGQQTAISYYSGKKLKWHYTQLFEYNELGLISKQSWKTKKSTSITVREYN